MYLMFWCLGGSLIYASDGNNVGNQTEKNVIISQAKAIEIAKQALMESKDKNAYKLNSVRILKVEKYPDYWFIAFSSRVLGGMATSKFLVVISKSSGEIIIARDWWANKMEGFDWVFQNRNE